MQKSKAKMGRPSAYNEAVAAEIIERISGGESLRAICRDDHMPPVSSVIKWLADERYQDFRIQYTASRDAQADVLADEMIDIADDKTGDVQRDKLRLDTRRWVAARLKPKKYGDRAIISGDKEADPVQIDGNIKAADVPDEVKRALAFLVKKISI